MSSPSSQASGPALTTDELIRSIRRKLRGGGGEKMASRDAGDAQEILRRIRHRLQSDESPSPFNSVDTWSTSGLPRNSASGEFAAFAREIETALVAQRQFGELNPRMPGLHNRAIQFVKKMMRRSLTWYTAPLHLYQGASIRALQRLSTISQGHEDSLATMAGVIEELRNQNARLAQVIEELRNQGTHLAQTVEELRNPR